MSAIFNLAKGKYKNLPKGARRVPILNMCREDPSTVSTIKRLLSSKHASVDLFWTTWIVCLCLLSF